MGIGLRALPNATISRLPRAFSRLIFPLCLCMSAIGRARDTTNAVPPYLLYVCEWVSVPKHKTCEASNYKIKFISSKHTLAHIFAYFVLASYYCCCCCYRFLSGTRLHHLPMAQNTNEKERKQTRMKTIFLSRRAAAAQRRQRQWQRQWFVPSNSYLAFNRSPRQCTTP